MASTATVLILAVICFFIWRGKRPARRRRRAPVSGRDPLRSATRRQRQFLWHCQKGLCGLCGYPLAGYAVDCHHVIPWSRGGRTITGNMVLLHKFPCHSSITAQQKRSHQV